MTSFGNPDEVLSIGRKLTAEELKRALRLSIADEYEAVHVYTLIAEAVEDEKFRAVIMDIVREEQVHASQFWDLLARIDPSESEAYERAVKENKELMGK